MFLQFQILFIIEKTDNTTSYRVSQVLSFLVGLSDMYLHA